MRRGVESGVGRRTASQECGASARLEPLGRGVGRNQREVRRIEDPQDPSGSGADDPLEDGGGAEHDEWGSLLILSPVAKVFVLQLEED